jgi:hypothetical protein
VIEGAAFTVSAVLAFVDGVLNSKLLLFLNPFQHKLAGFSLVVGMNCTQSGFSEVAWKWIV